MDPSCSYTSEDEQTRDLKILLDAFGAVFTLEDIASAYCSSGGDMNATGVTLYELKESKPDEGIHKHNGTMVPEQLGKSSQHDFAERSTPLYNTSKGPKSKKLAASMGIVSNVLGKGYSRPNFSSVGYLEATKPLKLELKEPLIDEPGMDIAESVPAKHEPLSDKDIENFLFSMLGDGFKLDEDKIRNVLGSCGYDARKGMEELLETSPLNLEKGNLIESLTSRDEAYVSEVDFSSLNSAQRNVTEPSIIDKERSELPKVVLETLFNVPKGSEEPPTRTRLPFGLNRTRVAGQKPVSVPFDVSGAKPSTESAIAQESNFAEDEADNYGVLRRAAKQHWITMKAYYEAAIDAFTKGDRTKANYLLEQGKFYNKMAREADEKSAGVIVDVSKEKPNQVTLDLHCHDPKGAIRLLKCHLRSLAGIPSIQFLKVIVDTDAENSNDGKRRRLVMKLLEKESIRWTPDEGNAGTILIHVDVIKRSKLSFAKD